MSHCILFLSYICKPRNLQNSNDRIVIKLSVCDISQLKNGYSLKILYANIQLKIEEKTCNPNEKQKY